MARRLQPASAPAPPRLSAREDVTEDGPDTRHWVLEAAHWPAMSSQRLAKIGLTWGTPGYRRIRVRPSGSFVMAVCQGSGRVMLDGAWKTLSKGTACMAPPRVLNAFEALPGQPWILAWLRYDEPLPGQPMVGATSPQQVEFPSENLLRLVEGIRAEWEGAHDRHCLALWLELIQAMARRLAQPAPVDAEVWSRWEQVGKNLAVRWDLDRLAAFFSSSKERLRQVCLKQLGRSPMEHLTYMRMQHAQQLLISTNDKLDSIARDVGYDSGLVFARAFRRWIGCTPTEFRRK